MTSLEFFLVFIVHPHQHTDNYVARKGPYGRDEIVVGFTKVQIIYLQSVHITTNFESCT